MDKIFGRDSRYLDVTVPGPRFSSSHYFLDAFSIYYLAKCLMELIEYMPENRSVGGSTPPLGTISFDHLATTGGSQWRPGMESSRLRV